MHPIARVVYPEEYVTLKHSLMGGCISDDQFRNSNRWPETTRLVDKNTYFLKTFEDLSDAQLIHHLDRELENNSLVSRPSDNVYKPWSTYSVPIPFANGGTIHQSQAEHYYGYWQVHQLYRIQQFPDLYRYKWLIDLLPDNEKRKRGYDRPLDTRPFATFLGRSNSFDALSFWITVYDRERDRTFAAVPELDGVKTLSSVKTDEYGKRLHCDATMVLDRFHLEIPDLYRFLHELMDLLGDYKRDERLKLYGELRKDVFSLVGFIECAAEHDIDKIELELNKHSNYVRDFRHLHIPTKERDDALLFFRHVLENCDSSLRTIAGINWTAMGQQAEDILDHCANNGLDLLVTALSGMTAIGDDEYRQKFRRIQRYSNLKHILTSYEYFLKFVGDKAGLGIGGLTLTRALGEVMRNEPWFFEFQVPARKRLLNANDSDEFLDNLEALNRDVHLQASTNGLWGYFFLATCLGRNMTVHAYPNQQRYYGELFGSMLDSVVMAIAYTWDLAKTKGWL